MTEESRCYSRILECYDRSGQDEVKMEECMNKSLIKLMRSLKKTKNKQCVSNAIIIILSLFNRKNVAPDLFNNMGTDLKHVTDSEEKAVIHSILKETIN